MNVPFPVGNFSGPVYFIGETRPTPFVMRAIPAISPANSTGRL